ncbi:MAG TPA: DNA-formamidopyrimidine glycosylase family protein [Propionibacteriaceae bacterium]|nr:DNA-formamidopyrimidine glycosylase family protein [Propionibacteriaceae bacterium]
MPEGDTVKRVASRLNEALGGAELVHADLRWPGISTASLTPSTTVEVVARGKHLLHRLDSGWTIHSHLRMDGMWRVRDTSGFADLTNPAIRAVVASSSWTAIGWRLGMLDLVRTSEENTLIGHLGPDLLGDDWDASLAGGNLASDDSPIGAALLDQTNLAGIGTLWCAETLFLEAVNPWTPASALIPDKLERIVARAHRLVTTNVAFAVQSSTGIRRSGQETYAHGRRRRPCRRCGTPIRMEMIGPPTRERTMYFCPTCQHVESG